jgi:hypothetical protein
MEKKEKRYAVRPDGHVIEMSRFAQLKEGWRYATEHDIAQAAAVEKERAARESASKPPEGGPVKPEAPAKKK